MSLRVFGVGNPLLLDDGIGVAVSRLIDAPPGAVVCQGEIFVEDCLSEIEDGDTVIILDAVHFRLSAGSVVAIPFQDCARFFPPKPFCHDVSLLDALLRGSRNVSGFLIGIQVSEIGFSEGLSPALSLRLPDIVWRVNQVLAAYASGLTCQHETSPGD